MNLDLKTKNRKEFHFFKNLPLFHFSLAKEMDGPASPPFPSFRPAPLGLLAAQPHSSRIGPLLRGLAPARQPATAPAHYSARRPAQRAYARRTRRLPFFSRCATGPARQCAPARVLPFSLTALPAPPVSRHHPLSFFPALLPFSAPPMARARTASYRRRCSYKASRPRPFGKRPISPAPLPSMQHPRPIKLS